MLGSLPDSDLRVGVVKEVLLQAPCEETLNVAATGNGAGRGNVLNELQSCDWYVSALRGFP